jgi:mxaA protein
MTMAQGGLPDVRADRAAPTIPTEPMRRQIHVWSTSLILALTAWLAWWLWRNRLAAAHHPFACALREMRGLNDDAPESWQVLHRAFDRAAGRVSQSATLPSLFERAPYLELLRPEIERFFAQSTELFFGDGLPADRVSVHGLCTELRRVERRYEP